MFTTAVEQDRDGFYLAVDHNWTDFLGLEPYHPDMKWPSIPIELGLSVSARASLEKIEATVRKNRLPISSTGMWRPTNEMLQVITHRKPTIKGGFQTVEHVCKVSDLYHGWPLRLNHHLKVLVLPNGKQLTKKDLSVLHLFVLRSPRKLIAQKHCCSIAAVEKRLAKIKDILTPQNPAPQSRSLSQCLIELNLIPFLLSELDHFDPIEFVTPHIAHNLDF